MKDRLIELLCKIECKGEEDFGNCPYRSGGRCSKLQRLEMCSLFAIADHLLAEGVIVPPVKLGQAVFYPIRHTNEVMQLFVREVVCTKNNIQCRASYLAFTVDAIGKTVFLTREEAEKALERSENGKS